MKAKYLGGIISSFLADPFEALHISTTAALKVSAPAFLSYLCSASPYVHGKSIWNASFAGSASYVPILSISSFSLSSILVYQEQDGTENDESLNCRQSCLTIFYGFFVAFSSCTCHGFK